jgi:hypothetical protein
MRAVEALFLPANIINPSHAVATRVRVEFVDALDRVIFATLRANLVATTCGHSATSDCDGA